MARPTIYRGTWVRLYVEDEEIPSGELGEVVGIMPNPHTEGYRYHIEHYEWYGDSFIHTLSVFDPSEFVKDIDSP